jgi:hypothetical protein
LQQIYVTWTQNYSCLFPQGLDPWHLLLHFIFALKHLHRAESQSPLHPHLEKPWPLPIDESLAASRTLIDLFGGISSTARNFSTQGVRTVAANFWLSTPCSVPILCIPCSLTYTNIFNYSFNLNNILQTSIMTPLMLGNSARPRSISGTGTITVLPMERGTSRRAVWSIIRSACFCVFLVTSWRIASAFSLCRQRYAA